MNKVSLSELKVIELMLRKNSVTILSDNGKKYSLEGVTAINIKTQTTNSGIQTLYKIYCIESVSGPSLYRCCLTLTRNDTGPYTGELEFLDKHV